MSHKAFRRFQISNVEGTPGTPEAAVEVLSGVLTTFEGGEVVHQPEEDRNSLALHHGNAEIIGTEAHLVWTGDLNFRHICWQLAMAICGNITPTQPDAENEPLSYLWTFVPALTAVNTPDQANGIDTFTMEYGDNTEVYEAEHCFATRIQISGRPNDTVRVTVDITGRQQSVVETFTAGLTMQAVQRAAFNRCKLYINDSGAAIGTTQKTSLMRAFTWTLDTKFRPWYTGDGNLYFTSVEEGQKAPELELTLPWGTVTQAERAAFLAQTTRFIRLECWGSAEMDEEEANPPYLQLDGAYSLPEWPTAQGEDEGRSTVVLKYVGLHDATWGKMYQAAVKTNLAAFPGA